MKQHTLSHRTVYAAFFLLLTSVLCMGSCKTAAHTGTDKGQTDGAHRFSADFRTETLSNGITVVAKNNDGGRTCHLRIIVEGGIPLVPPESAGIEDALFSMMTRGSEKYSADVIRQQCFDTQASFGGGARYDSANLAVTAIDYYFDAMLDILLDGFLHPVFPEKELQTLLLEYNQQIQQEQHDPSSLLLKTVLKDITKDHPYQAGAYPDENSIGNITVEALKKHHALVLNAARISVVATGNIDIGKLKDTLEKTLGSLPVLPYTRPEIPPYNISTGDAVVLHTPSAKGTAFTARTLQFPVMTDPDYYAAYIAAEMYDKVLFNIVREKYGACYSISTATAVSRAAFAIVTTYRTSDLAHIASYIQEAEALFASGMVITGKDSETGGFITGQAELMLPGIKNSCINSLYSAVRTSSGTAAQIGASLLIFGNPYEYLNAAGKIQAVTIEDVAAAFNTYWIQNSGRLFIVTE